MKSFKIRYWGTIYHPTNKDSATIYTEELPETTKAHLVVGPVAFMVLKIGKTWSIYEFATGILCKGGFDTKKAAVAAIDDKFISVVVQGIACLKLDAVNTIKEPQP